MNRLRPLTHLPLPLLGSLLVLMALYLPSRALAQDDVTAPPPSTTADAGAADADTETTEVIELRYAAAEEVSEAVRQVLRERGRVSTVARTNSLIITAPPEVIQEAITVLKALDVPGNDSRPLADRITMVFELRHVKAEDALAPVVQAVGEAGGVCAVPGMNALVITAPQDSLDAAREVIEQIDKPVQDDGGATAQPTPPVAERSIEIAVFLRPGAQVGRGAEPTDGPRAADDGVTIEFVPSGPDDGVLPEQPDAGARYLLDAAVARLEGAKARFEQAKAQNEQGLAPQIDVDDAMTALRLREIDLAAAQAAAEGTEQNGQAQQLAVEKAQVLLEAAMAKLQYLPAQYDKGLAPQGDVDDATTALRALEIDLAAAQAAAEGTGGSARVQHFAVEKAQALLDGAMAKLQRVAAQHDEGLVPQSDLDDAASTVKALEADLAAAEAATQGTGMSSTIDPATGLPGMPLGPYEVAPDGSAASPDPLFRQLLEATEAASRSRPSGPGQTPDLEGALTEPKRAETTVSGPPVQIRIDWPENAPRYYLDKVATEGNDLYNRVELADRPGFSATLTPAVREGVPVIGLELVRRAIAGGEYDADIGAMVGRPQVFQTTCTASAPVLPGLTTVVTWRQRQRQQALPVEGVPLIAPLFMTPPRPSLQIRMRMAGGSPAQAASTLLTPGMVIAVPPTVAPQPASAAGGAAGTAEPAEGPATVSVWQGLFELEVGSPEWNAVNEAEDPGAKLLSLRDEGKITPETQGWTPPTEVTPPSGGGVGGAAGAASEGSFFESIEGEDISVQVTRVFRVPDVDADLIGLAISCTLRRAAIFVKSDPDRGMLQIPGGMTIQYTAHPVLTDRQHACFRGFGFLRFTPAGYGVKDVRVKEAFLIVAPYFVPPGGMVGGGMTAGSRG